MLNKDITKNNLKKVKTLIENIKTMSQEDFKKILKTMVSFHKYSFYNQIILYYSGASQVAGFKTWKLFKRNVKHGSKAIWILAPAGCYTIQKRCLEDGKEKIKDITFKSFKSVPVFDIKDTEGEPINKGFTTESKTDIKLIKEYSIKKGFSISYKPLEIATGGYIMNKDITLNSNLSELENTGSLVHELSHGLLGHSNETDNSSRSLREQEAEILTFLLNEKLGIKRHSEFYLKGWDTTQDIIKSFKKINAIFQNTIKEIEAV